MAWLGLQPRLLLAPGSALLLRQCLACRSYAKKPVMKAKGKSLPKDAFKGPEICKDPVLLTSHAMGANIYKEGPEVALKPDSEYPEWLFQMHLGPPKKLGDLDPESREYWRLLRKLNVKQKQKLAKVWAL
ncbi:large ribosomal subunit protein mL54 [Elgaria multicarinata webbii]|uniref:large ribosomal subunit protein mL54 n=1 Tax=Elgaria multicarinata webbii TaxID=159646 RepID=UPI002FCD2C18